MKKSSTSAMILAAIGLFYTAATAQAEISNCQVLKTAPVTISSEGIYCLKSDIGTLIPTGAAVTIKADNVTLDLNGFSVLGDVTNPGNRTFGIVAENQRNITIRNGRVSGFFTGVALTGQNVNGTSTSSGHLIENIKSDRHKFTGITLSGDNSVVRNNRVLEIAASQNTVVKDAKAILNYNSKNAVVTGNIVSDVKAVGVAAGIRLDSVEYSDISRNTIQYLTLAQSIIGISFQTSSWLAIHDNSVLNITGIGTAGIGEPTGGSAFIGCIDNIIAGFIKPTSGCNFVSGNKSF